MASDLHRVNRGRDIVAVSDVFDASEEGITDAITDLLHLAWVGTNDDGEGMFPEALAEAALTAAVTEFRATIHQRRTERYTAEQLAEQRRIRHARLTTALTNLEHEEGGPLPSADPLHPTGSPYLTHDQVALILNRATDDLITWLDMDETGARDQLNLLVNLFTVRIVDPGCSIEDAIRTQYQDPTDAIADARGHHSG